VSSHKIRFFKSFFRQSFIKDALFVKTHLANSIGGLKPLLEREQHDNSTMFQELISRLAHEA